MLLGNILKKMKSLIKSASPIHGIGIFTEREIMKDEVFYQVPLTVVYPKSTPRCAFMGNNRLVSDEAVLNYVNYSCDPNSLLDLGDAGPRLVSRRTINPGEKITVAYVLTEKEGTKISCNCKNKNCRGYLLK